MKIYLLSAARGGLAATIALLAVTIASAAHATSYRVNTTLDTSGASDCSLRDAINAANGSPTSGSTCTTAGTGTDTIAFQSGMTGTISLGSTLPPIADSSLTITGPATSPGITIDGGGAVELIQVNFGSILNLKFLTLADGSADFGGGILSEGTLTVANCTFSGNSASFAGAIYNDFGTLTITNTTFSGNGANSDGGGIYNDFGTLTVTNSTFSGNSSNSGGGIFNDGALTVTNSTFSSNSAPNYGGDAIYNFIGSTVTVTNSTFTGNSSGSAIYNELATLTVTNSTFSGNSANYGGAIFNESGTVMITNGTFAGNSANSGGALYNDFGTLTVNGTILASSPGGNCYGSITDGGYNISDDNTCGFTVAPSGTSVNNSTTLNLGTLANNGGPTQTIALESNSQAIDFIPIAQCVDQSSPTPQPLTTDQRGYARLDPLNSSSCDAGAYEFGAVAPNACSVTYNRTFRGNLTVSSGTICITNGTVTGNVQQNGGSLVTSNATIKGNLQINGGGTFSIDGTTVEGDLQIQSIPAGSAQNQICGTTVKGQIQVHNNGTAVTIGNPSMSCSGDTIGKDLQVMNNATVQVFDDTVGGHLQCQGNSSITGGADTAKSLQGQCAGF